MMNLHELITQNPNINLTIKGSDLQDYGKTCHELGFKQGLNHRQKLYPPNELCNILHISRPTLWRNEKAGRIKSVTIGGKKFYTQSELDRLINGGHEDE